MPTGSDHPALFNDRLLLGLKGAMSEAELHVLRARLDGGIRNKATRGELRRGLPVGYVWGEAEGEVLLHPDEAVVHAVRTVFARFTEMGSARRVWKWFRDEGLKFPRRLGEAGDIRWSEPEYSAIYGVLSSPVYAGAYAYGRTHRETVLDEKGTCRKRVRRLTREQWPVLIRDHHEGYIDWQTYESNRRRMDENGHPRAREAAAARSGAVREGRALLQGLVLCGHCGRRLRIRYGGRKTVPNYHCPGRMTREGRDAFCLSVGGAQIDEAVTSRVPRGAAAGPPERDAGGGRAHRKRPRSRTQAMAARCGTRGVCRGPRGTALSGRRPGQPSGGALSGTGMGEEPEGARGSQDRAGASGARSPAHPDARGA